MGSPLPYSLRLALLGLRRDKGISLATFLCLALGATLWTAIASHAMHLYGPSTRFEPGLAQVELPHPRARALFQDTPVADTAWQARTRVTFPEYQILAKSGFPAHQAATYRSQVLVASLPSGPGAGPAPAIPAVARFADGDLFSLFHIPLAQGRVYSRAEEESGLARVVLGQRLNEKLFGARNSTGQEILVEGRPFRIVGIVKGDQPFRPEWDLGSMGGDQDALYLPFSLARALGAWPEQSLPQSPLPRGMDGLLRSDWVFVSFWVDLATPGQWADFHRYLEAEFGPQGYELRGYAQWSSEFDDVDSDIPFFTVLMATALLGAAFSATRLLLAKAFARQDEIGIHRALGATRRTLFWRQVLETTLLAVPAAVAGAIASVPFNAIYNAVALAEDIPVRLTQSAVVVGLVPSLAAGFFAALYPAWRLAQTPPTVYLGRR